MFGFVPQSLQPKLS